MARDIQHDDRIVVVHEGELVKARVRGTPADGLVGYSFAKDGPVLMANEKEVYPLYRYYTDENGNRLGSSRQDLGGMDKDYGPSDAPVKSTSQAAWLGGSVSEGEDTDSDEDGEVSED